MVMLIKKSVGVKAKIQMRMLGAVVLLYLMLIISGLFSSKTRESRLDKMNDSMAISQNKVLLTKYT